MVFCYCVTHVTVSLQHTHTRTHAHETSYDYFGSIIQFQQNDWKILHMSQITLSSGIDDEFILIFFIRCYSLCVSVLVHFHHFP